MRKAAALGVVLSALVVIGANMVGANADGSTTIQWQGQGSDNLPCDSGGHWILADSHGQDWAVTSATLTVNGQSYTMTQNGEGSWSADSDGALTSGNVSASASITYTGTLPSSGGPQLVLSSCSAGTGGGGGGGGTGSGGGTGGGGSTGGGTSSSGQGAASAGVSSAAATAGTAQAATAVNASPGFTG
jgi:hypothetical protein